MDNSKSSDYKFLLISRQTPDAYEIKTEIERNRLYKVEMAETAATSMEKLTKDPINCLVYNFESFTTNKIKLVTDLRDLNFRFPILLFASYVQAEALLKAQTLGSLIIEKPYEAKDVWGICYKALQGKKLNQRIYRRFYTDQTAVIEKTVTGETLSGQIYNLSRGGAYMEMPSQQLKPGEILKVTIPLDKISRSYKVDAQVVWANDKGFWKGNPAVGLRFVKAGDIYRNLLDKL